MQLLPLLCAVVLGGQGTLQEARELVNQFGTWRENTARSSLLQFPPEIRRIALLEGLKSSSPDVQSQSAFNLSGFKDEQTRKAFEEFLPLSQGEGRVWAVYYLSRTEYTIPTEILVEMLSQEPNPQQAALSAMERQKRADLAPAVSPLVGSRDSNTAAAARRALLSFGEAGFRELARQLETGDEQARDGAVAALSSMPADWRKRLFPIALRDRNPEVLRSALYEFSRAPEPSALPLVLKAANSDDNEVLGAAIMALSYVDDPRSRSRLLHLTKHARFASSAVYGLGRLGDPSVLPQLMKLRDPKLREALARTILQYGVDGLPFAARLLEDHTRSVRLAVVYSLQKDDAETWVGDARDQLIAIFEGRLYDPSPVVQNATIRALGFLGVTATLPTVPRTDDLSQLAKAMIWDQTGYAVAALGLAGKKALPHLLPLLDHYDAAVRARAVDALAVIREPSTFDRLGEMFDDPEDEVQHAAHNAFVRIGPDGLSQLVKASAHHWAAISAVPKIRPKVDDKIAAMLHSKDKGERLGALELLGHKEEFQTQVSQMIADPDREIRYRAAMGLVARRDPAAIPVLMKLLPNMGREERLRIIQALGSYPGKHGLAELRELYRSRSWERRYKVAEAIVRRNDVDSLLPLLADPVSAIRGMAIPSLGHSKDQRAVLPVRKMVADPSPGVRRVALHAIGTLNDAGGFDHVLARLKDSDKDVRWVAASVLGTLRDPRAVPHLIKIVETPDDYARGEAAISLGRIGDRRATPVLLRLLEDKDPYDRRFAARALGHLNDPAAIPALEVHAKETDMEVAREAMTAIARIDRG